MTDPFRNYDAWLEAPIQRAYAEAERYQDAFEQWCEDEGLDPSEAEADKAIMARFETFLADQESDAAEAEAERRYEDAQEPADWDPAP